MVWSNLSRITVAVKSLSKLSAQFIKGSSDWPQCTSLSGVGPVIVELHDPSSPRGSEGQSKKALEQLLHFSPILPDHIAHSSDTLRRNSVVKRCFNIFLRVNHKPDAKEHPNWISHYHLCTLCLFKPFHEPWMASLGDSSYQWDPNVRRT